MRSKILFLVAAAAAFSAPAYAGDTDTAQAAAPAAKVAPQIAPPPAGMGQVVFYRPSAMGGLVSCRVS